MTYERLTAYRVVRRSLEDLTPAPLDTDTAELLRDFAEGLLLTRDPDEAEELASDAAMALALLVSGGRLSDEDADRLWQRIARCSPDVPVHRPPLHRIASGVATSSPFP